MALSDMVVFNEYLMPLVTEMFPQEIQKFNAASANTLMLTADGFDGSFYEESFYKALFSSQRRVDRFATNSTVASTPLDQEQWNQVKVAGGFGPIEFEPSQLTWLRKPTQEGLTVAAEQFTQALLADQLNTAIATLVAAIENQASLVNDVSGGSEVTQTAINDGLALFGDRSQAIEALIMTGLQYHNLVGQAIDNSNNLFEIGGIAVREGTAFGQGRPIIITDAPALRTTDPFQKVLGLVSGAARVHDGSDVITNVQTNNGSQRIFTTVQMDYSFGLGLKGYSWDETNGGASPDDTDLTTGTNWDLVMSSTKDTAGVLIIGDES